MRSSHHHGAKKHPFAWLASITALLFLLPCLVLAAALEEFQSFVLATQSAKGEFVQQMLKGKGKEMRVSNESSGTFVFSRPGKFIWHYQKPYEQQLQSDGEKLYIYDKDLNQVTIRALGDALGSSPAAILFGSNDLAQNFTLKEVGSKDGVQWLEAIPKTKDTTFERIKIGMKDRMPSVMELHDSFGQVSLLTFSRFTRNHAMSVDQFKFSVPEGADVFE